MSTTEATEVATQEPEKPLVEQTGPLGYLMDSKRFEHLWRVAKAFSASQLMPEHFHGHPEDCFIGCQLAVRLNVDPFMLMQNLYVVHGRPGMEAKLVIALLNGSGKITGTIQYQFDGKDDDYGCRAYVLDAATGKHVYGPMVTRQMVKAEGWDKPKKTQVSKWVTMPDQMFRYRAAAFLVKAHYPEVMMGLQTREEVEDAVIDVEPTTHAEQAQAAREARESAADAQPQSPAEDAQPAPETPSEPQETLELPEGAPDPSPIVSKIDALREDVRGAWDRLQKAEQNAFDQTYRQKFDAATKIGKITSLEKEALANILFASQGAQAFIKISAEFYKELIRSGGGPPTTEPEPPTG